MEVTPSIPAGLEYRSSTTHGVGVFATRRWAVGEYIGDFSPAVKMLKSEFREKYGNDIRHTYWTSHNFKHSFVLVAKETRNFVTYINERAVPNVVLKNKKIYALCDIEPDDELFLRYASNYPRDYIL